MFPFFIIRVCGFTSAGHYPQCISYIYKHYNILFSIIQVFFTNFSDFFTDIFYGQIKIII